MNEQDQNTDEKGTHNMEQNLKTLTQDDVDTLVVNPKDSYHGRSYGALAMEFMQWLVQYNPDNQALRDVIFTRGVDFGGYTGNLNHRFVRIGKDALTVYSDQAIFVPLITYLSDSINHNIPTPEKRIDYVHQLIQAGETPNKTSIALNLINPNITMEDHLVMTRDFPVYVPEPVDGQTLGQDLDVPLRIEGTSMFVVAGYFVLFRPLQPGRYLLSCYGNGENAYRNQTFMEFNVVPRPTSFSPTSMFPSETQALISIVEDKIKSGEIVDADIYYDAINALGGTTNDIDAMKDTFMNQIKEFDELSRNLKNKLDKAKTRGKKMINKP
jgi:hypothetical protein